MNDNILNQLSNLQLGDADEPCNNEFSDIEGNTCSFWKFIEEKCTSKSRHCKFYMYSTKSNKFNSFVTSEDNTPAVAVQVKGADLKVDTPESPAAKNQNYTPSLRIQTDF